MASNYFFRKITHPPHEKVHHTTRIEIGLAIIIAVLLTISLTSQIYLHLPFYAIPGLIGLFIALKIYHILKKGGTLLEDYAAIGAIAIFLILYLILGGKINIALTTVLIFILLYSAGFMIWVKSTFGSKKVTHFIVSYVVTVIMIVFLFAGGYASRSSEFIHINQDEKVNNPMPRA